MESFLDKSEEDILMKYLNPNNFINRELHPIIGTKMGECGKSIIILNDILEFNNISRTDLDVPTTCNVDCIIKKIKDLAITDQWHLMRMSSHDHIWFIEIKDVRFRILSLYAAKHGFFDFYSNKIYLPYNRFQEANDQVLSVFQTKLEKMNRGSGELWGVEDVFDKVYTDVTIKGIAKLHKQPKKYTSTSTHIEKTPQEDTSTPIENTPQEDTSTPQDILRSLSNLKETTLGEVIKKLAWHNINNTNNYFEETLDFYSWLDDDDIEYIKSDLLVNYKDKDTYKEKMDVLDTIFKQGGYKKRRKSRRRKPKRKSIKKSKRRKQTNAQKGKKRRKQTKAKKTKTKRSTRRNRLR